MIVVDPHTMGTHKTGKTGIEVIKGVTIKREEFILGMPPIIVVPNKGVKTHKDTSIGHLKGEDHHNIEAHHRVITTIREDQHDS